MVYCAVESNLTTAQIVTPFESGWVDSPDWLVLRERVTGDLLEDACALVDAIEATRYFETHSVVSDLALVSSHRSTISMHTSVRPDEVEHATVQLGESSSIAEALARSTVHHFYGIEVVDWVRSSRDSEVMIYDGPESLRSEESGFTEDLARAWFVLTSLSIPTHVFLAPTALLASDQESVREMVVTLRNAIDVSNERRRELRRNVSADLDVDREKLTDFLNDQTTRLTRSGRKGWMDLMNRASRAMNLPSGASPDVVTFGLARDTGE
jgi:predicted solute-binding protein